MRIKTAFMKQGNWDVSIALLAIVVTCEAFYTVTRNGEQCEFWWSKDPPTTPRPTTTTTTTRRSIFMDHALMKPMILFGGLMRGKFDLNAFLGDKMGSFYEYVCTYVPHQARLPRFYTFFYPLKLHAINGSLDGLDMGCKGLSVNAVRFKEYHYELNLRLNMSGLRIKYDVESNIDILGSKIDWALENGSFLGFQLKINEDARCLILFDNIDLTLVINSKSENNMCTGLCNTIYQEFLCYVHKAVRQMVQFASVPELKTFIRNVFCFSFKS